MKKLIFSLTSTAMLLTACHSTSNEPTPTPKSVLNVLNNTKITQDSAAVEIKGQEYVMSKTCLNIHQVLLALDKTQRENLSPAQLQQYLPLGNENFCPLVQYSVAKSFINHKDYIKAEQYATKLAEQDFAEGQVILGDLYLGGLGVSQNAETAANWYRKAAEQGDAQGQYRLGLMYLKGIGVEQNKCTSKMWLQKAASQKYAIAQYELNTHSFGLCF